MFNCKSILIVDDDSEMRELVKETLASFANSYFLAGNGVEALEILKNTNVEIIITDLGMPQMNGFEFIRRLRKAGSKTPLLVLTGQSEIVVAAQLSGYNPIQFLSKPFSEHELIDLATKLLKGSDTGLKSA